MVQNHVINETVSINEDIASGIQLENDEFGNVTNIIANMVQNNTQEIATIFNQADTMDKMVNELEGKLWHIDICRSFLIGSMSWLQMR